jgi:hypothetical protein
VYEYRTHLKNLELVYSLDEKVLSCSQTTSGMTTTASIDLRRKETSVKRLSGFPSEFKIAVFGCMVAVIVAGYYVIRHVKNDDSVGIVGSIIAGIVTLGLCGYYALKSAKRREYLFIKNKVGTGLRVLYGDATDKKDFDDFVIEVENIVRQANAT